MRLPHPVFFSAIVICALAGHKAIAAEGLVVIESTNGARISGQIDGSSTAQELVLSKGHSGITLRRPIAWQRIASATIDGRPVAIEELRAEAAKAEVRDQRSEVNKGPRKVELRGKPAPQPAEQEQPPEQLVPQPRVTRLTIDPYIANWDGDVETDGLVVTIAPLDWYGSLVPASGTVEVELFAAQRRVFHHAPLSGGDTLELVERWTRQVTPADFGPGGVQLRLPYGAIHPELRPDWMAGWYGLVHVKMTAPGHGVFEDSRDGVRIRPWAPNRDQLELNTGRRFLPTERLGRVN